MNTSGNGLRITAELEYPRPSTKRHEQKRDSLIAYCVIRIEDGRGFNVVVNSVRLKYNHDRNVYYLSMPAEPKQDLCPRCERQNCSHARFCNWCGHALHPAEEKGWFVDVVRGDYRTRETLLQIVLNEHERRQDADQPAPRPVRQ